VRTVPRNLRLWAALTFIVIFSATIAWCRAFTSIAPYDDEGSMMYAAQGFMNGSALYDNVHTIYGPVFFAYESIPHLITGGPISHDSVRVMTILFWLVDGIILFLFVYRATGSILLSLIIHFVGFRAMRFMGYETAHPQEICLLLVLAFPLAAYARRRAISMAWFGALVAILALTKINAGILAAVVLVLLVTLSARRGPVSRIFVAAVSLGGVALPFVLMNAHLREPQVVQFAFLVAFSLVAVILATAANPPQAFSLRQIAVGIGAALVVTAALVLYTIAHGSTLWGIIDGIILWPRTHLAQVWYVPLFIGAPAMLWAALNVPLAWLAVHGRLPSSWIAGLKLAMVVIVIAEIATNVYAQRLSLAVPMLWLLTIRPEGRTQPNELMRPLLALLAAIYILYAYPVAGSQVRFVMVPVLAAAGVCAWDGLRWFSVRLPRPALQYAAVAATLFLVVYTAMSASSALKTLQSREALGLPGAQYLHLDAGLTKSLRQLYTASQPCSMLVTFPGILSLNLFTGKEPPVGLRGSPWMLFMNDAEQEAAVRELTNQRLPCVVYNPAIVRMWTQDHPTPDRPLVRYILASFRTQFESDGYRFMLPNTQ
jgi:hypothetical protein